MILTKEIFDQGISSNNGYNTEQLKVLGLKGFESRWKRKVIGKDFPEEVIKKFLELKDAHFKNPRAIKDRKNVNFIDSPSDLSRREQYLHPNWQRMRLQVLKRDRFRCVNCRALNKTLHAHHLKYNKNGLIWEVPHWYIVTLCEDCHSEEHCRDLRSNR